MLLETMTESENEQMSVTDHLFTLKKGVFIPG